MSHVKIYDTCDEMIKQVNALAKQRNIRIDPGIYNDLGMIFLCMNNQYTKFELGYAIEL